MLVCCYRIHNGLKADLQPFSDFETHPYYFMKHQHKSKREKLQKRVIS